MKTTTLTITTISINAMQKPYAVVKHNLPVIRVGYENEGLILLEAELYEGFIQWKCQLPSGSIVYFDSRKETLTFC